MMKKMYGWLATLLTVALLLGGCTAAFAEEAEAPLDVVAVDGLIEEAPAPVEEALGGEEAEAEAPAPEDGVLGNDMSVQTQDETPTAAGEGVAVTVANFPDDNFRDYVSQSYDTDNNGYLSDAEIAAAREMFADGLNIHSMDGIEYLTALEELYCRYNYLYALNLSKNTKLEYIQCDGNNLALIDFTNNPKVVHHILNDGVVRSESRIRFMALRADDDPRPYLIFDEKTALAADGMVICDKDTGYILEGPSATLGINEQVKPAGLGGSEKPEWYTALIANECTFRSSDSKVVKVRSTGRITGKKAGTAYVYIMAPNGIQARCEITVKKAPSSVKLSSKKMSLMVGEEKSLTATTSSDSASQSMTWTTSNKKVAFYDETQGVVVAVGKGTANITVKTFNGRTARCKVTVTAPQPTYVDLRVTELALHINESFILDPDIDDGASTTFTYKSSNRKVAYVSSKGVITGKKEGTATITVKTKNGLSDSVTVYVAGKMKRPTTYTPGMSGVDVYVATNNGFFHSIYNCGSIGDANRVTLEEALNAGKTPCPECFEEMSEKVYGLSGGSYYHLKKSHVGSGSRNYTLATALASGMEACPLCAEDF